jgi:hypothetical protein
MRPPVQHFGRKVGTGSLCEAASGLDYALRLQATGRGTPAAKLRNRVNAWAAPQAQCLDRKGLVGVVPVIPAHEQPGSRYGLILPLAARMICAGLYSSLGLLSCGHDFPPTKTTPPATHKATPRDVAKTNLAPECQSEMLKVASTIAPIKYPTSDIRRNVKMAVLFISLPPDPASSIGWTLPA